MRTVCYSRVSTEEQIDNYSLPRLEEAIRKYAKEHDMEIVKASPYEFILA